MAIGAHDLALRSLSQDRLPRQQPTPHSANCLNLVAIDVVEIHHIGRVPNAAVCARPILQFVDALQEECTTFDRVDVDTLDVKFAVFFVSAALVLSVVSPTCFRILERHLASSVKRTTRNMLPPDG